MQLALCFIALLGHAALWAGILNRLFALALRPAARTAAKGFVLAGLLGVPALAVAALRQHPEILYHPLESILAQPIAAAYLVLCCLVFLLVSVTWLARRCAGPPRHLVRNHSQVIRADRELGRVPIDDLTTRLWAGVPGNQLLHLEINEKTLCLPRLPAALVGLRIAHLSDLHFIGQVTRDYFDLIVDRTNALQPDLIAITGDIIDQPVCLPWFEQVLGRLHSRLGTFCILGNHERKMPDRSAIVAAIQSAGLNYLGGAWTTVAQHGQTILLAGNEMPWWGPAPDMDRCRAEVGPAPALRILLAHTPDQIQWARRYDFDLMLAGHTHGGQIRFPILGPVLSHSRYGVKYAGGVFFEPPTLLHVSRGLSGCQPLRILCRPELALLVLRAS